MERIIIYTNTFPPEFGAAPSRLFDMAKALQNAGHVVEVFTSLPNYPKGEIHPDYKGKFTVSEDYNGISTTRHWQKPSHSNRLLSRFLTMFSLSFSMLFTLRKAILFKPSIVIVQYPPIAVPLLGVLCAKLSKSKFILNVSDLWSFALSDLKVSKKKSLFSGWISKYEKWFFKNSDLILAQSEEILQFIQTDFPSKSQLYRTGVDCQIFQQKIDYKTDGKLKIVYVGVLGMAHGVLEVCQNIDFSKLNAELHVFGNGFERKQIEKYLKLNSENSIFLHDSVSNLEVPKILAQHDVALIPQKANIFGTFPAKTYEAMAVGLPILFHGGKAGIELVYENEIGLVSEPQNWEMLTQNIREMGEFEERKMREMGNRSRKLASSQFDRKQIASDFANSISNFKLLHN